MLHQTTTRRVAGGAAVAILAAAIAAGCGGGSGGGAKGAAGGASEAATESKALDFVPKDAVLYAVADTDFDGDGWKNFDNLAPAFYEDWEGIDSVIEDNGLDELGDGDEPSFKDDIEPWLGDEAGFVMPEASGDEFFGWVALKDRTKFESLLKDEDYEQDGSEGDFDIWVNGDEETAFAVGDDFAFVSDTPEMVKDVVSFDGESVLDADGVKDVAGELDDSLFALVVTGEGLRAAAAEDERVAELASNDAVEKFQALAFAFTAADEGFAFEGFGQFDGLDEDLLGKNSANDTFRGLPADSLIAAGAGDLGGSMKQVVDALGDTDEEIADGIGAFEGLVGVTTDEVAEDFSGDWALALSGDDSQVGGLIAAAFGAASGGLDLVDPESLAAASSVTLALAGDESTMETFGKLVDATETATGTEPEEGTAGDFDTKSIAFGTATFVAGTSDDLAVVTTNSEVLEEYGEGDTLDDNEAFADAWKAADAPDETSSIVFVDAKRIATIAEAPFIDADRIGGLVGWSETDGDDVAFHAFLHVGE